MFVSSGNLLPPHPGFSETLTYFFLFEYQSIPAVRSFRVTEFELFLRQRLKLQRWLTHFYFREFKKQKSEKQVIMANGVKKGWETGKQVKWK